MTYTTRFAPSPTGPLHLGHAFSALTAWDMAQAASGQFLLRIEDIDSARVRPEWEALIFDDLHWLGLDWPTPVMRQSTRLPAYRASLRRLWDLGLLYPCTCNRKDIAAAAAAPQEGGDPLVGPDGLVYPGTCRTRPRPQEMPSGAALRLDMTKALALIPADALQFMETGSGPDGDTDTIRFTSSEVVALIGDIVLARRDMGTSYHLSVVLDDADQAVSHVIRGQDLFEATKIHAVLQHVLGLATPIYHHHALIRDDTGKRLAKRDDARAIRTYRDAGYNAADIRAMVGL